MKNNITMIYHLGGAYTDANQMTTSLKKNPELLKDHGVLIKRRNQYRNLINDSIEALQGEEATLEQQESLLAQFGKNKKVDRIIFSNDSFMGVPSWMFQKGVFYGNVGDNTSRLRKLFPNNPCEFFLGIRSPSSFIPEAIAEQANEKFHDFLDAIDLKTILWSDVIRRIQEANPDCPITVWCYEDTPILWPTILREITDVDYATPFKGDFDVIQSLMQPNGLKLLKQYLNDRPKFNERQRRRIRTVFLDKFVIEGANEIEASISNWTQNKLDSLTQIYEHDVELIESMPGVNLISL